MVLLLKAWLRTMKETKNYSKNQELCNEKNWRKILGERRENCWRKGNDHVCWWSKTYRSYSIFIQTNLPFSLTKFDPKRTWGFESLLLKELWQTSFRRCRGSLVSQWYQVTNHSRWLCPPSCVRAAFGNADTDFSLSSARSQCLLQDCQCWVFSRFSVFVNAALVNASIIQLLYKQHCAEMCYNSQLALPDWTHLPRITTCLTNLTAYSSIQGFPKTTDAGHSERAGPHPPAGDNSIGQSAVIKNTDSTSPSHLPPESRGTWFFDHTGVPALQSHRFPRVLKLVCWSHSWLWDWSMGSAEGQVLELLLPHSFPESLSPPGLPQGWHLPVTRRPHSRGCRALTARAQHELT